MQKGHLTDDNRHEFIDPASLVIKIGVFPPRQKGLIARQSSEIKCLDSTRLTDLFDRIFCPTNAMSLLSGHDFAENPSKFSNISFRGNFFYSFLRRLTTLNM